MRSLRIALVGVVAVLVAAAPLSPTPLRSDEVANSGVLGAAPGYPVVVVNARIRQPTEHYTVSILAYYERDGDIRVLQASQQCGLDEGGKPENCWPAEWRLASDAVFDIANRELSFSDPNSAQETNTSHVTFGPTTTGVTHTCGKADLAAGQDPDAGRSYHISTAAVGDAPVHRATSASGFYRHMRFLDQDEAPDSVCATWIDDGTVTWVPHVEDQVVRRIPTGR